MQGAGRFPLDIKTLHAVDKTTYVNDNRHVAMYHPLNSIPQGKRLATFVPLLVTTVALSITLRVIGPSTPNIVEFELAGSIGIASSIIDAWDIATQLRASLGLGLDYLFMPVYSTTIALACIWGAGVLSGRKLRALGVLLAWGLWLAAVFDAVENLALLVMLFGTVAAPYPQMACICATCKFSLIILGLVYIVTAITIRIIALVRSALRTHGH